jgi:hypothetical protein
LYVNNYQFAAAKYTPKTAPKSDSDSIRVAALVFVLLALDEVLDDVPLASAFNTEDVSAFAMLKAQISF